MARFSIYEQWKTDGILKDILTKVEAWSRDGLIQKQIAKNLGINIDTLINYKKDYPEFSDALKRGKEVVDIQVENSLLKRAMGYNYTETKIEKENGVIIKETVTVKEVVPDTTAQIFWLKNRKKTEWRDKQEVESTNINMNDDISNLTKEERSKRISELKKKLGE